MTRHELLGEGQIALRSVGQNVVPEDRLSERRGLGQPDISRNGCFVDAVAEILPRLGGHLSRQVEAPVEHREQHTLDLELRVERPLDAPNGVEKLTETLQGLELALDRNQ